MNKIFLVTFAFVVAVFMFLFFYGRIGETGVLARVETYLTELGNYDQIVEAIEPNENKIVDNFMKIKNSSFDIITEMSIDSLINLYRSEKSYIFFIDENQKEELRKKFPRMSLIEIKSKTFFLNDEVFYMTKNKCNCGE